VANCPYCGRWFRNKQAVRAHLKRCPLKEQKTKKEEIITKEFEYKGWRFKISGKKGFIDILKKTDEVARKKRLDALQCIIGAVYSLYFAGIVTSFSIKPINR